MSQFMLAPDSYRILSNGDTAYTIIFDESISKLLTSKLAAICRALVSSPKLCLLDAIPSYQSITLFFDNAVVGRICFLGTLTKQLAKPFSYLVNQPKLLEIPVCYEAEYAPDLAGLARQTNLSVEEVISRHISTTYWVNMLGFLPGFLYLSGLDKKLNCPRKNTPNLRIAPGSIAIGGEQTGIYPVASPGGWHVIGRTPIKIFKPNDLEPAIAHPLDEIKFVSISKQEFVFINSELSTVSI